MFNKKEKQISNENLIVVKQWSFHPYKEDNDVLKESFSDSDKRLLETLKF